MDTDSSTPQPAGDAALQREAWAWLRRLNGGEVRAWDTDGFKRWLHTSPAHQAAFRAARRDWAALEPAAGALLRNDAQAAARHRAALRGPALGRRAFLGAAASAAAVAGVAVVYRAELFGPDPLDDRTATGEQRRLALARGASVTLNTQTRIRRQMTGEEVVGIDLLSGEAAIDLSAYGGRPFVVVAGTGRSETDTGGFQVRHLDGETCVTCIEGRVRVTHPAGTRELRPGQQTLYNAASVGAAIAGVDTAAASAWRKGELVFDRTPLAQVVAEINRYRPGRVLLMNAAAGRQPVSGSFDIAVLDLALVQLAMSFELEGRTLPGGLYVLA